MSLESEDTVTPAPLPLVVPLVIFLNAVSAALLYFPLAGIVLIVLGALDILDPLDNDPPLLELIIPFAVVAVVVILPALLVNKWARRRSEIPAWSFWVFSPVIFVTVLLAVHVLVFVAVLPNL